MLNRYVFSGVLNVATYEILRRVRGSEFHNLGALTLNDLPPTADNRKRGMDNKPSSADLRDRAGW